MFHRVISVSVIVLVLLILFSGGILLSYLILGLVMLLSFAVMVESISMLRYLVYRLRNVLDIMFLFFNIYISLTMGVTIGLSFIFFQLFYSLLYKRYMVYVLSNK